MLLMYLGQRQHWNGLHTSHAYSLVEKRLENNDLIALFNEAHERTQHSFSSDVS